MEINKIYQGDSLEVLKTFPNESINMVITSPPYWALRDYKAEGQLGLEEDFNEYIKKLCDIFDEIKRVLTKGGGVWVNIGDTFYTKSGSNFASSSVMENNNQYVEDSGLARANNIRGRGLLPDKCMVNIPFRFAIEMCNRGWIQRNSVIWWKRNVLPSSCTDRLTQNFEHIFFFTKSRDYFFDQQFEKNQDNSGGRWGKYTNLKYGQSGIGGAAGFKPMTKEEQDEKYSKNGRNLRCVWDIIPQPTPFAHFAPFPEELALRPILASCPEKICNQCGAPKEKIYETNNPNNIEPRDELDEKRVESTGYSSASLHRNEGGVYGSKRFVGYTDCGCENKTYKPGIVLDPFAGASTSLLVAKKLGRNYVGIEINPEFVKLGEQRLQANGDFNIMQVLADIEKGVQKTL